MNVQINDVTFGYDSAHLSLRNVSFSVASTKSVSIVGPSGCGKSTLLRLLCGLLPNSTSQVYSGSVRIDGSDILTNKSQWRQRLADGTVGFMFQEPCLLPHLSVKDNINLPLRILGNNRPSHGLVTDYLVRTGLEDAKEKLPSQLSGGMKARTALARTFISKPKLLLLDEPFSSLDIVWKAKLYEELTRLKEEAESTLVLVTHDIFEAIYFSRTIVVMGNEHSIVGTIEVDNWEGFSAYDEVINRHHEDFVTIKQMLEGKHHTCCV